MYILTTKNTKKHEKILKPLLQKKEVKDDTLNYAIIQANLGFIYFKLNKRKQLELYTISLKTRDKIKHNYGFNF